MLFWDKVSSWDYMRCKWCEEIRDKYAIRFRIANELALSNEVLEKFENLSKHAVCPLHKELTVHPWWAKEFGKFNVEVFPSYEYEESYSEPVIIFRWWSNNHSYKAVYGIESRWIDFYKNDEFVATLVNHNLVAELLVLLDKKTLEWIEEWVKKIKKEVMKRECVDSS